MAASVKRSLEGADVKSSKKAKTSIHADRPAVQNLKPEKKTEAHLSSQSSREAHLKQKALAQARRDAKPNADTIARSLKIWNRLRRKSHVPKEERQQLVDELFQIITGSCRDFVFKHDSVRVIQCALKYASPEQRKQITEELKGSYRELAESKYAKFLIAKMVLGDEESRDAVMVEFFSHVKRLIRHPEACWVLDDMYRTIATKQQKAILLREWYGPEFVVFGQAKNKKTTSPAADEPVTAELSEILAEYPEKRGPIMSHLREMNNQLVQKKTTGFTMLHDALLQYFLNCKPGSPEITEFLSMLHDDEEGDLQRNLAFTKSGSRLLSLCLAHGTSKDRRGIMKFFKTHIKLLAGDQYGYSVLLTAYDVIDDTVMTSKTIFPELLSRDLEAEARDQELLAQVEHLTARIPLLYLMSPTTPKWLIPNETAALLSEIRDIRKETSKKDPESRRLELLQNFGQLLLDLIARHAQYLAQSTFGCQFITEIIFGCSGIGEVNGALAAIASLATEMPEEDEKRQEVEKILATPAVGRMLKSLVQGGRFDKATKSIKRIEPCLNFHEMLFSKLTTKGRAAEIVNWTNGPNSFIVVAMLEADHFEAKEELVRLLKANAGKLDKDNKGAAIVLEKIGAGAGIEVEETKKQQAGRADGKDDAASSGKQKDEARKEKKRKV